MFRFIDLTGKYHTNPVCGAPACAFLNSVGGHFLSTCEGIQVFTSQEQINEMGDAEELKDLVPNNFFDPPKTLCQCIGCGTGYRKIPAGVYEDGHGGRLVNRCPTCGCDLFVEVEV